jgi:nucleoside-diphosphate-sugar epimerase
MGFDLGRLFPSASARGRCMRTILMTGASGFVGARCLERLLGVNAHFDLCLVQRREPRSPAGEPLPEVRWIPLDLAEPFALDVSPSVVLHLAGEKRVLERMRAVNVEGTRRLVEWSASRGVEHFIYLSSVGVYGAARTERQRIQEDSVCAPANEYERTKYEAEHWVSRLCAERGLRWTILRPSNVLGDGEDGRKPLLGWIRSIARGRVVFFGREEAWFNYVAVDDVATAAVVLAGHKSAHGVYILNEPLTQGHAAAVVARALGVAAPSRTVPRWWGSLAVSMLQLYSRYTGRASPLTREQFEELTNRTCYDGSAITRQLGVGYECGVEATLRRLARRYQAEGCLG